MTVKSSAKLLALCIVEKQIFGRATASTIKADGWVEGLSQRYT